MRENCFGLYQVVRLMSVVLFGMLASGASLHVLAQAVKPVAGATSGAATAAANEASALQISPEGVLALSAANIPYLLIHADAAQLPTVSANSPLLRIYYSFNPSVRSALNLVQQDRAALAKLPASEQVQKYGSQYLSGTPLDWQRLGLKMDLKAVLSKPQAISAKQLAAALKDGADLQILDLRPAAAVQPEPVIFPQAQRVLPHQVLQVAEKLSKQRWLVLIDNGGRVADTLADQLSGQGFALTAFLDGGYPAWLKENER